MRGRDIIAFNNWGQFDDAEADFYWDAPVNTQANSGSWSPGLSVLLERSVSSSHQGTSQVDVDTGNAQLAPGRQTQSGDEYLEARKEGAGGGGGKPTDGGGKGGGKGKDKTTTTDPDPTPEPDPDPAPEPDPIQPLKPGPNP